MRREGRHGCPVFENAAVEEDIRLAHGEALGKLLGKSDVWALALNACPTQQQGFFWGLGFFIARLGQYANIYMQMYGWYVGCRD
jgi:hypothetical protein